MPPALDLAAVAPLYALDFSSWKRSALRQCFPGVRIVFIHDLHNVPEQGVLLVWGMKPLPTASEHSIRILRVEDGFLRSVGLGVDLVRPMSWVIDGRGIYYNATQPSDLENLLQNWSFSPDTLERAVLLQARIVNLNLTKYNVGLYHWQRPQTAGKVLLVPGQVESDASLRFGACTILTNLELLKTVRTANPDAYLLYKPHPDVLAGLRRKGQNEDECMQYCDELLTDTHMGELLNSVDDVHVLTSLSGFEALLRGKTVYCYGLPFYSGWGLTIDAQSQPRRSRRLTLPELIAGALIEYPKYLGRDGKTLLTPEAAIAELLAWRDKTAGKIPWWREYFRMILRCVVGVT